jgi:hypothetical protein
VFSLEEDPYGDRNPREDIHQRNWIYINYDSPFVFSALDMSFRVLSRIGYEKIGLAREKLFIKPGFYLTFFNNLLQIGTAFEYAADIGSVKLDANAPYLHWFIEPSIQLNLGNNSYLSLVYRYYDDFEFFDPALTGRALNTRTHWVNLRVLFTF